MNNWDIDTDGNIEEFDIGEVLGHNGWDDPDNLAPWGWDFAEVTAQ